MSWTTFTKLIITATIEVAEPENDKLNLLFKFRDHGVLTYLETSGKWKDLKEGDQVKLRVERYECEDGMSLETIPPGREIPFRSRICSADPQMVKINNKLTSLAQ